MTSETPKGPLVQMDMDGFCEECGGFEYCLYSVDFGVFVCQDCAGILGETITHD